MSLDRHTHADLKQNLQDALTLISIINSPHHILSTTTVYATFREKLLYTPLFPIEYTLTLVFIVSALHENLLNKWTLSTRPLTPHTAEQIDVPAPRPLTTISTSINLTKHTSPSNQPYTPRHIFASQLFSHKTPSPSEQLLLMYNSKQPKIHTHINFEEILDNPASSTPPLLMT